MSLPIVYLWIQYSTKAGSMVTQTSEYALRAVVHLARAGGGSAVAQDIAAATKVPLGYLQKILRMLARAGILQAQRGVGGGYSLARSPTEISILDVLNATANEVTRITTCPLGIPGHTQLCALHRLLDEQAAGAERVFGETSIQSLLAQDETIQPRCRTPCATQSIRVNGDGGPVRGAAETGSD